jgi:hypothetical protein
LFLQYWKFSFVPEIEFLEDIFFFVFFMLLEFNFRKKAFLFQESIYIFCFYAISRFFFFMLIEDFFYVIVGKGWFVDDSFNFLPIFFSAFHLLTQCHIVLSKWLIIFNVVNIKNNNYIWFLHYKYYCSWVFECLGGYIYKVRRPLQFMPMIPRSTLR